MAKQAGDFKIVGTFDNLCYYKLYGEYYVRMKSSLTSKRFWQTKAFEGSRKSCKRFGEGNTLASKLYCSLDEDRRVYKLFCFLKRRAISLLKEGNTVQEAEAVLTDYLVEFGYLPREVSRAIEQAPNGVIPARPASDSSHDVLHFLMLEENVETGWP